MINEFDKEMDSLLRKAAQSDIALSKSFDAHPDAEEISLFAANDLPVKMRSRVTEHLADCDRCRKILSNIILLNAEAESETVPATEIVAASIPWYKKLFVFPQIAYAMGALALVFSGIITLIVLQNTRDSQNSSIAKMDEIREKQSGGKGMSSDGEATSTEIYPTPSAANSNMSLNSSSATANTNVTMSKPVAPVLNANSTATVSLDEKSGAAERETKSRIAPATEPRDKAAEEYKKEDFVADASAPQKRSERDSRADDNEALKSSRQAETTQNSATQSLSGITPDARNVQRSLPVSGRSTTQKDTMTTEADSVATMSKPKTAARKVSTIRSISGKTFNFKDGAWYDSAYNNQKTTNVRRGTDEYKKLDSGLRSIAENIGGTIIVIWKDNKTYRIQ